MGLGIEVKVRSWVAWLGRLPFVICKKKTSTGSAEKFKSFLLIVCFSHSYVIWYVLCAATGKAIEARFLRDVASSRSNICTCNRAKMVHRPSRTECFVRCRSVFLARFAEKAVVFGGSVLARAQSTHFLVARLREQAVI